MKNVFLALIVVVVSSISAFAEAPQQGEQMPPGMMKAMPEMPMMPCMAMMRQTMGQDMLIYEMMQTMKDMIAIQERLMEGAAVRERRRLVEDLSRMKDKVDRMMSELSGRMKGTAVMHAAPQPAPAQSSQGSPHQH